jgi:hypothetical protein
MQIVADDHIFNVNDKFIIAIKAGDDLKTFTGQAINTLNLPNDTVEYGCRLLKKEDDTHA